MPLSPEDQERAELDALGVKPAPPDHWVYKQGTAFVGSNSRKPSSATPLRPRKQEPPLPPGEGFVAPDNAQNPPSASTST